jgi:ribonuclease P/MRP protein subunit RPP40
MFNTVISSSIICNDVENVNNNSKNNTYKSKKISNLSTRNRVKVSRKTGSDNSFKLSNEPRNLPGKITRQIQSKKFNNHLNIIYFNARSLRNKMEELRILVCQCTPDIIGVVETWLTEENFDGEISITNYNFIRKDRINEYKSKGGGLVIYFKQDIPFVNITTNCNMNVEHLWVKVPFKGCKPITLGMFYRPPDSNEEQLKFLLDNIATYKTVNTIIIGDFNYGDINWNRNTTNSVGKKFLKTCTDLSLRQCVKYKTRGKNILDLVLVYDKNLIYKVTQLTPLAKSDHNVLNILLNVTSKVKDKQIKYFNYNKADYSKLAEMVDKVVWDEEMKKISVNHLWTQVRENLNSFKERYIPQCNQNSASDVPWLNSDVPWLNSDVPWLNSDVPWLNSDVPWLNSDVPWLNSKLKRLIKKRNNLFKRYKKNNQSYSKIKYIMARNEVTKQIRLAKNKYECNIIKRSKNNRKVFYSYVASKNRKSCSKRIGPLLDQSGRIVADDKEMASLFNNYFASVFTKNDIKWYSGNLGFDYSEFTLQDIIISENEVINSIGEFKAHKSPGIDGITSTYALKTKEIMAKPLCLLYNSSIERNQIPLEWKEANISPIFKKGDKSKVENYRPVSLTVFYGKVLEKIIKKHIENFLLSTNFIKNSQHGFMKGRSCLSNLLIGHNSIVNMIDNGYPVDVIYLDFQKAFDKVPHSILMAKVRCAGIVGKLANWLENWLEGRYQRVGINGVYSEWAAVASGVPQGSILGPLLFTIFINDLEVGIKSDLLKFADDSKIWGKAETVHDRFILQQDLNILSDWALKNQMPFNVSKCKVMHIGRKNVKEEYVIMNQVIPKTQEEKDLGVFFSDSFKPSLNCKKASKSANKIVGMIGRNISTRHVEGMMILYKTLVRPILDYCIPVWRPHSLKDVMMIEKVQKRYTKMIEGCKRKTYEQRLSKLGITSLADRHYRADMIQVFKVLKNGRNIYPEFFLELNERPGRKNSMKLIKKRSNLDICKYSFTSRVVDPWNDLPDAVVLSADVNAFKGNLDRYMRESRGQL